MRIIRIWIGIAVYDRAPSSGSNTCRGYKYQDVRPNLCDAMVREHGYARFKNAEIL